MPNESKPGSAAADRVREQRQALQRDTRASIRAWRDSIDLGPSERPPAHIFLSVEQAAPRSRRSLGESLRPHARKGIAGTLVALAIAALAALVRAYLESHGLN